MVTTHHFHIGFERRDFWLMRARCPLLAKGYPASKCRKNYLSLVRRHSALADLHNLHESDLYE
jgi:hypothetical protein